VEERGVSVAIQLEDSIQATRLPNKAGGSFSARTARKNVFRQALIQC